jgi:hypothetical protein
MPSTNGHGSRPEPVAFYLRVSSEEQRDRETIEIQGDFLEQYRGLYELEVAEIYKDDGISGTIPLHERPGGRRLLEDAKAGKFRTVIVYKLDRLGRSLLVIVDAHDRLETSGVSLRSATEPIDTSNPSGRLIFQMLASFAEYERGTGCVSNRRERRSSKASEGSKPPHRVPNIPAEWLEGLVWADVRAFLADPGEVLERVREHMADEDDYAELEQRRGSLKKRLAEVEAELNRLLNLYATGEIDAEWLTTHVRDREGRIDNLKLLIASVESDMASREQDRLAAAQTETWLRKLADNLAEVEGDTPEAFQKRRELVQLLVEKITADRDGDGRPRVHMTYRFGPPPEEPFVPSVRNSGPKEAEKMFRRALSPPPSGTRKFGWA